MNVKLHIALGAYSDGSWYVATVQTAYDERGRAGRPSVVASRVVDANGVRQLATQAVDAILEYERRVAHTRSAAAAEREQGSRRETTVTRRGQARAGALPGERPLPGL